MKKNILKSVYIGVFIFLCFIVVSCEEDFTDIGSNVISNTKFDIDAISYDVVAQNSPLEKVQTDNITRQLGQYLLGVYNRSDYENMEASIVAQLRIASNLKVVDNTYGADTVVVTKIDTVFLKLPYQFSLKDPADAASKYKIDSVFGDATKPFNLNIYRSNTFINRFNPSDPSKNNAFYSNDVFEKIGANLNDQLNFPFLPNENDTALVVKRRQYDDLVYDTDTLKFFSSAANTIPIPFARIPLNEDKFKELFLDKYETGEFSSQDAFDDYFRGIIIEASGNEGSLVSFNFNSPNANLAPTIEVYYSNTVLVSGSVVDTVFKKRNTFPLTSFKINTFKMEDRTYPVNNQIKVQGTAGSEGSITLFTQNQIDDLRANNWLINDATVTFYINQSADTTNLPSRLYLYKTNESPTNAIFSQIKDATSETGLGGINGFLERDASGKKEKYVFSITDYVSDIVTGEINYIPTLKLKAFNPSDLPASPSDTIFRNYSWTPKAVTLFNNDPSNGNKKSTIKISYSDRK